MEKRIRKCQINHRIIIPRSQIIKKEVKVYLCLLYWLIDWFNIFSISFLYFINFEIDLSAFLIKWGGLYMMHKNLGLLSWGLCRATSVLRSNSPILSPFLTKRTWIGVFAFRSVIANVYFIIHVSQCFLHHIVDKNGRKDNVIYRQKTPNSGCVLRQNSWR